MMNKNGEEKYDMRFSDCNKDFIRCNKAAAQHVERKIWPLSAAEREADAERGKWAVSRQHPSCYLL